MLPPFELHRPADLSEALGLLAEHGDDAAVYMGGTELLLLLKLGLVEPGHLVDGKGLAELQGVRVHPDRIEIGAAVTYRHLERDPDVAAALPALTALVRQVANVRVRNAGTLAGNLCFAEPHSDPATLLIALDAEVELASPAGRRRLPLGAFVRGPLDVDLRAGEIMTTVVVPRPAAGAVVTFRRLALKERPTANVATVLGGPAGTTRVVVGAAGPRPVRVRAAEELLAANGTGGLAEAAGLAGVDSAATTDGDGTAEYKRHLVEVLVRRAAAPALAG